MMKRVLFSFFLLFLSYSLSNGEVKGHGVEVRLTSPKLAEVEPGRIVTGSLLVSNNTEHEELFFEELKLPPGWQVIAPQGIPFKLESKKQEVRIIAFSVPVTAPAGSYHVAYSVRSQRDYGITDSDTFSVVVLPVLKLQMIVEDRPEAVIAGEMYEARAQLINKGNSETTIKVGIKSIPDYPVKIEPSEATLEPGGSQTLQIEVKTDEKLNVKTTHILTIKAQGEEVKNGASSAEQSFSVVIMPRVTGEFDPYHRLNSQVRLTGVSENGKSGFQAEFAGSGSLDEEGKRRVDFLFRGPDTQDKSRFGERDEYRFSYYDALFDLHLGDRSYTLSPLTEQYRYGRGSEVNIHPGKLGGGVFYLETRWESPKVRELGTYIAYQFNDKFSIKGNFLNKDRDSNPSSGDYHDKIYSIQAKINPDERMDLDLEYSFNDSEREKKYSDDAYRAALRGQFPNQIWYSLEKIHAGPKYFGYYNDADYTTGTITIPIYQKLRGNFSYRSSRGNIDNDPAKGTANRETSYRAGVSYPFSSGTNISLDYEDFHREDRLLPIDYNFGERVLTLGLGQTFQRAGLQAYIELGELENRLSGKTDNLERYSLYAYFHPSEWQTYSVYARIGNERYSGTLEWTKSAGASATWNIINNLLVNINYNINNFDTEKRQKQDNLFSTISYIFPNKHFLSFRSYWSKIKGSKEESSFILSYTIPLKLPVSKKKGIGMLKGRLYDGEKEGKPPIPNAVLTIGEATAVTDRKGEFMFPSLKPGAYFLKIEKGSIGLHRVATEKIPITLEIKGGETTQVEIAVVASCRISGRVEVFDLNGNWKNNIRTNGNGEDNNTNNDDNNDLREAGVLSNILVEIANGKEILRELTDNKGMFSFEDIRLGKWTVKVYDEDLPLYHYLETEEVQFELMPGDEKEITFRVLPRIRTIQVIEEGEIKQEKRQVQKNRSR
jgi:hypothetical protein